MGLLGNKPWIKLGALAAIAGAVAIAWQVDAQTRATSSAHGGGGGAPAGSAQRAPAVAYQGPVQGVVTDAVTHAPIADAIVTTERGVVRSDAQGRFTIEAGGPKVMARAAGYRRSDVALPGADQIRAGAPLTVPLAPLQVKALYLSTYGIGSVKLRNAALGVIERNHLNALVIDFKGDRGMLPFKSDIPAKFGLGDQKVITVRDMPALIAELKQRNLYLIARIVSFKDDRYVEAHPEAGIRRQSGELFADREHLRWVDANRTEMWDYNGALAEQAAQMGFDEVQFDYVRFPDANTSLVLAKESTEANRVAAITGYLKAMHKRLEPYNVFMSADIFGYVCWNTNDTGIGQQLEEVHQVVDYMAPMLYPSGFTWGIPGTRNPVADSYTIVRRTIDKCRERIGVSPLRFRPWLQSFKDYAFDRRVFGEAEIRDQIRASDDSGASGWMLWNPRNSYSDAGLTPGKAAPAAAASAPASAASK
ncbi:putative glycoside hydrolase [Aquabacterium sp.]|uniref:putative glycoside hydrolase n=1 Tax=Aquabacterium sp. TaxID=1872578 RepID=UPI0035B0A3C1